MCAVSGKSLHLKPGDKVAGINILPNIPTDLVGATTRQMYERQPYRCMPQLSSNVRDQRRRAIGAPLANRNL